MTTLSQVRGLLLDLNGVFYVAHKALEGAADTVRTLKASGIPHRFATNNTTASVAGLSQTLHRMGLPIEPEDIISAPYAAVLYLRQKGRPKIYPLLTRDVRQDFAEFDVSETAADVVIVGDMGEDWNYAALNRAFKLVMKGAELIALHKGKFWQWEAGLQLDLGAFVAGLEYATDTPATLVGKPSPSFFELALQELGLPASQVAMVGDDVDADVGGAQALGMQGVLVRSGKYREALVQQSPVTPDLVIDGVGEVLELMSVYA
ncbi:MAG TPA: TIGR01458 family HAD-type hydrolase [Trichocoleus sp.]